MYDVYDDVMCNEISNEKLFYFVIKSKPNAMEWETYVRYIKI